MFERIFAVCGYEKRGKGAAQAAKLAKLAAANSNLSAQNAELGAANADLSAKNADLSAANSNLSAKCAEVIAQNGELAAKNADLTAANADLNAANSNLSATNAKLAATNADLTALKSNLVAQTLRDAHEKATLAEQLKERDFARTLTAQLLGGASGQSAPNPHVARFGELLAGEFAAFANADNTLNNEMEMTLALQGIERELARVAACAQIYSRPIVAVAGGFSAGKSTFISSFFKDKKISLPVGMGTTTAIPTFVTHGAKPTLTGMSASGGAINLTALDGGIHERIKHGFEQQFGFPLKKLMPSMVFEVPFEQREFEPLCFIDTPGYDAAQSATQTRFDEASAREFLGDANALLWLVGLDVNGTIPRSDLAFLHSLSLDGMRLHVVLSKADTRSQKNIRKILDEAAQTLESEGIAVDGISTYSTLNADELFVKCSLWDFLLNVAADAKASEICKTQANLIERLFAVYRAYATAICAKIAHKKELAYAFGRLEDGISDHFYTCNASGASDEVAGLVAGARAWAQVAVAGEGAQSFDTAGDEMALRQLESVILKMHSVIDSVFLASSKNALPISKITAD